MKSFLLPSKSVLIAHPGTQHSHQTALGLYKAGILKKFFTGFFYSPNKITKFLLSILPKEAERYVLNQLLRRRRADLPEKVLHAFPYFDLATIISARVPFLSNMSPFFSYLHQELFSHNTSRHIKRLEPKIFIGYEGFTHQYFQVCSELGICKILDHTTGSVFKGREIYLHESKAFPQFANNLSINKSAKYYSQHQKEIDLADGILVASSYVKENLIEHGVNREKIYLLPYGVDLHAFNSPHRSSNDSNHKIRLLYAGAINQHKGIMYLLQAFQNIEQENIELVLVGNNFLSSNLQKSFPPKIKIQNHLPKTDLIKLYHESDIFVFPAIHEGSSLVVYEAMAAGLPVITTPNAGSIIENGKDGLLVPSGDIEMLKNRIQLLANNSELRIKLGAQAAKTVKDYSWEKYHARLEEIVKDIYFRFLIK